MFAADRARRVLERRAFGAVICGMLDHAPTKALFEKKRVLPDVEKLS